MFHLFSWTGFAVSQYITSLLRRQLFGLFSDFSAFFINWASFGDRGRMERERKRGGGDGERRKNRRSCLP